MGVDTEKMRADLDAVPGERVALLKNELRLLLDAVDTGQRTGRHLSANDGTPLAAAA